jgi:hypothetical protein
MKKNLLIPVVAVVGLVVVVGIYLVSQGSKQTQPSSETVTREQTTKKDTITNKAGCTVGTTKTVVGLKYQVTGQETYTIQGKSYDLCCWETGEGTRQKKICSDIESGPVGYNYGVLFENNKNTGSLYKSMETYRDGNNVCQQFYEADGSAGPLNCKERLN